MQQYFIVFFFLQCLTTFLKALDDVMFLQVNKWCFAAVWYVEWEQIDSLNSDAWLRSIKNNT
jgi:hypothetical protein